MTKFIAFSLLVALGTSVLINTLETGPASAVLNHNESAQLAALDR